MILSYIQNILFQSNFKSPSDKLKGNFTFQTFSFSSCKLQGINRAQLTLQELQSLAERQREQILYNSQELMEKQQQLMKMHHDYRAKLKAQQETNRTVPKGLKVSEFTYEVLPRSCFIG